MRVITTRDLTKLQAVPIEDIIEKLDAGVHVCFVDSKEGIMKLFSVSKCEPCDDAVTLSNLRASPRKLLSKDIDGLVVNSIGKGVRGGMREAKHWWKLERVEVV